MSFNDKDNEKRMVGGTGFEVKLAFPVNGKEIIIAENMRAEDGLFYRIYQYEDHGVLSEYSRGKGSDDYLEILREFTARIDKEVSAIRSERDALNLPCELFLSNRCYPHSYSESLEGKVVAIKAEVFSPEYRCGDNQLVYVTGGHGAQADSRGSAVFCYHLNNGRHTRFERQDVLGVVKELPEWAKESLARIQGDMDKPTGRKDYAGSYLITERIEAGQKVFVLGYNEKAVAPYGTWQGYADRRGNFNHGHYYSSYEEAKTDLGERAANEQERLSSKQRNYNTR